MSLHLFTPIPPKYLKGPPILSGSSFAGYAGSASPMYSIRLCHQYLPFRLVDRLRLDRLLDVAARRSAAALVLKVPLNHLVPPDLV